MKTAVEWLISELDKYEKGISEYFSKVAIYNHAIRMENEILIDLVQSLKDYTQESHTILGHDEREASEFVKTFIDVFLLKNHIKQQEQ